ncbi:MAG TPA: hypothetical protein VHC63_11000 [Acidimicrobiales bacterium]|nr:hypothetical protein [Acidimicrobiales bacterium]
MAEFSHGVRPERAVLTAAAALVVAGLAALGVVGNGTRPQAAPVAARGVGGDTAPSRFTLPTTAVVSRVLGRALAPATSTTGQAPVSSEPASLESTTTSTTAPEPPPSVPAHQVDLQVPGTAVHVTLGTGPGTCNDLGITLLKPDQCQGARRKS